MIYTSDITISDNNASRPTVVVVLVSVVVVGQVSSRQTLVVLGHPSKLLEYCKTSPITSMATPTYPNSGINVQFHTTSMYNSDSYKWQNVCYRSKNPVLAPPLIFYNQPCVIK